MNRFFALIALFAFGLTTSAPAWADHYRATVTQTQDGKYNALVEHVTQDGTVDTTSTVGKYATKRAAKKAAKDATEEKSQAAGVKDDETCNQPGVYC